jgi:predicted nucleic acid-binding protein
LPVCPDANIIVRWLVPQQLDPGVYRLVDGWIEDGLDLVAPALLYSEVVSVIRQQAHREALEQADAEQLLALFLRLGIRRVDDVRLYRRAFELATQYGHSRAYDAHYLAVAEREQCLLWTADDELHESTTAELPWVRHTKELA